MALKADPKLITAARVFDVYRGATIGEGKKSVAVEVTIQPRGAAMTDEQIEAVAQAIVKSVAKATGATLRARKDAAYAASFSSCFTRSASWRSVNGLGRNEIARSSSSVLARSRSA